MVFSAHQPNYFPYLGLFYKIYKSDYFIFLDDVQFTKSSGPAHDRNLIFDGDRATYIKVPVKYHFKDKINEVKINNTINWVDNHISRIYRCYSEAPYYDLIMQGIEPILRSEYANLADLNMILIKYICDRAGIKCIFAKSSDYEIKSAKTERLVELGKILGCDTYYSGSGAKVYMDCEMMASEGIKVVFSDYKTAVYTTNNVGCIANMSVLDYLFYHSFDFSALGWEKE